MTSRKLAHLLLVDDDPGLLKLLGMRLVSEGYSVVTAESGQEGLKVLSREKIDLVISDLRMDEMDGLQLFTEIQKQQPGMPVIILTAHGSIPDAVAATQQGVFSFLTKPVDKDALYKAIDSALEHAAPSGDDAWRESIVTRSPVMLRLLEQAGAEPGYFSPLHDRNLPENIHGLLLGGGYPELYAGQLSENDAMRTAIRKAVTDGLPTVAECGGFLYLHTTLTDREGHSYPMAGVLPGKCFDTGHLVRFGYIELEENSGYFMPRGSRIRAHEFHYYDSEDNGADCIATKPATGRNYPCIHVGESHWYGFPHLYYPSCPEFAERFVENAKKFSKSGKDML